MTTPIAAEASGWPGLWGYELRIVDDASGDVLGAGPASCKVRGLGR